MSIATSLDKLSETLTNCKTNLKEKKVENVDNIKISDVDEKIAEIQAGGGGFDEIISFIDSTFGQNQCIVLVKGYLNSNDFYCEIQNLKYGDNLQNSQSETYKYIKRFSALGNLTSENLYFCLFPNSWKSVSFEEYQDTDYERRTARTDKIDISNPGIVTAEMHEV